MDWVNLDFEAIANALVILLAGVVGVFGYRSGTRRARAPHDASAIEFAADFFDANAIKMLTTEVTGQAIATTSQAKASLEVAAALREIKEPIEDLQRELHELRDEIARHRR